MKKDYIRSFKWIRYAIQAVGLLLLGEWLFVGVFRCPFAVPFIACSTCPLVECPGTYLRNYAAWGLAGTAVVAGRVFCGWLCPLGFIQDLLGRLPKLRLWQRRRFRKLDKGLKMLKYVFLGLVLVLVFRGLDMVARPVRTGSNFDLKSIEITFLSGRVGYHVRLGLIGLALVGTLFLSRLWCRYFCPLGALLAPANKISLWRFRTDKEQCVDCGKYPAECPVNTRPGTVDCILCADCLEGCPKKAIKVKSRIGRCTGSSSKEE